MRSIVDDIGPCTLRPGGRGDHFTTLMRSIVAQQVSTKAAASIWERLVDGHADPMRIRPEDIVRRRHASLRKAGLSNAKATYISDLARRVVARELNLRTLGRYDDERIISELTEVKGIGRWTAEMFLIFRLGRPDVWPVDDLGIRNAVERAYGIEPTRANLYDVAEPWRPWRSVASWYLWRTIQPIPP